MPVTYDEYYQTESLFGDPYPELLKFFSGYSKSSKVLDLGCGQGRDAVALARMGFDVTGIDNSKVGIEQMVQVPEIEKLKLKGIVADIYEYEDYGNYDFVLLDNMFHFLKKDRAKETALLQKIIAQMRGRSLLVNCIQDTGHKVQILNDAIDANKPLERIKDIGFKYVYEDKASGHKSESDYRMVVVEV